MAGYGGEPPVDEAAGMSRRRAKTRPHRQSKEPQAVRKRRSPPWSVIGVLLGIGVIANVIVWSRPAASPAAEYPQYSAELVARGEQAFQANCATCHGPDGSGDVTAGVPALNGSMHSWHHPDSQIARLIRRGGVQMPAVGPDWSDEDITAVLAYVKQWWSPEQRTFQAEVSRANP